MHLHTHDTAGGQFATLVAAIEAGVDAVDVAAVSMAGSTSQPAMSALVAATDHGARETELSLAAVGALEPYWEATRRLYAPFESGLLARPAGSTGTRSPVDSSPTCASRLWRPVSAEKFEQIEDMYAAANDILGNIPKVTPSSKVIATSPCISSLSVPTPDEFADSPGKFDVPDSVIGFFHGELGDPPGGWPQPFRGKALKGQSHEALRPPLGKA